MGHSKSSSKREVYSNTSLPQETRKISNNLTLCLKQLEKEEQTKPKVNRRNFSESTVRDIEDRFKEITWNKVEKNKVIVMTIGNMVEVDGR